MGDNIFKNYWLWVAVILVAGIFVFFFKFDLPNRTAKPAMSGDVQLTVLPEKGKARIFEGTLTDGMTILQAVYYASKGSNLDFKYSVDPKNNTTLISLDNIANVGIKTWHFYLNDRAVKTSEINEVVLKKGDLIKAQFE